MSALAETERIRAALGFIPSNDRGTWVQVGMAVKSELGEEGFDMWDAWSRDAESYNERDARTAWKSFKGAGITVATLFDKARAHGYADSMPSIDPKEAEWRRVAREKDAEETARRHAEAQDKAAEKARDLWGKAGAAHADHGYVRTKRIKPYGAKQIREQLIVKIEDVDGVHHSSQYIQPDGGKTFQTDGRIGGCFAAVTSGVKPGECETLLICEGYATACSLHEATGYPVAAAMNAGNLPGVARAWRAKCPGLQIVVCADDDISTAGNPGMTKAAEAARVVGGLLAVPDFGQGRPDGATDFNDLFCLDESRVVRGCIESAAPLDVAPPTERASSDDAPPETDEQAIARLAALKPLQYDRARKDEAKRMGVRPATLDLMVKDARGEADDGDEVPFEDVELWPDPVDGAALLSDITRAIRRFIVCDDETVTAATLWSAAAWFVDVVGVCPILLINAPEKACGKTQLLTVVGRMVPRPAQAAGISPSVLFRMIEKYQPTLLVDEIETVLTREAEDLRGLMNAGHTRDSAFVWRSVPVGDDFEPKRFKVFGFKALAGINADSLAETITSRAVVARMRRKLSHETAERLRHAEPDLFDTLRAKLARWAEDNADAIRTARPALPDELGDREQDNWEPLLAVADLAGKPWSTFARKAAIRLCARGGDASRSTGAELLADIQDVFDADNVDRFFSADLIARLCDDEEKPWATWNRGKPMAPRQLSARLKEYGIESDQVRIGRHTKKGYKRSQFADAFARYLSFSPASPLLSETSKQPNTGAGSGVSGMFRVSDGNETFSADSTNVSDGNETRNTSETLEPLPDKTCFDVSDKNGGGDEKIKNVAEESETSPAPDAPLSNKGEEL